VIAAVERRGNNLKGLDDFHLKMGSRHGQNLGLTVPSSLDNIEKLSRGARLKWRRQTVTDAARTEVSDIRQQGKSSFLQQ